MNTNTMTQITIPNNTIAARCAPATKQATQFASSHAPWMSAEQVLRLRALSVLARCYLASVAAHTVGVQIDCPSLRDQGALVEGGIAQTPRIFDGTGLYVDASVVPELLAAWPDVRRFLADAAPVDDLDGLCQHTQLDLLAALPEQLAARPSMTEDQLRWFRVL